MKAAVAVAVLLVSIDGCPKKAPSEDPAPLNPTSPRITRFITRPELIHSGEKTLLIWNAQNVQQVLLEQAVEGNGEVGGEFLHRIGEFPASGTLELSPQSSTTYVISCGDPGIGSASASATVTVR